MHSPIHPHSPVAVAVTGGGPVLKVVVQFAHLGAILRVAVLHYHNVPAATGDGVMLERRRLWCHCLHLGEDGGSIPQAQVTSATPQTGRL